MDDDKELSLDRWRYQESKSLAVLWLRTKNRDLMEITQSLYPQDTSDEQAMDLFLDLTSMYGALDSAIDMVEESQRLVWDAQAKNAELKLTIRSLSQKVAAYERQFDELDEFLK